jgi:hypothetical protein
VPTVQRVVVDGSGRRGEVTVTFSTVVRFQGNPSDAFALVDPRAPVRLRAQVALDEAGVQTVIRLTFAGGRLAEGPYTLTIDGDAIVDSSGQAVDGDGDGLPGGDAVETFFRSRQRSRAAVNALEGANTLDGRYLRFLDLDRDEIVDRTRR